MLNYFGRFALVAVLSMLAFSAHAHDFWIAPEDFTPAPGDQVSVSLLEGVDLMGESLPYIPEWFSDFSVTDAAGLRPVDSIVGDDPAAVLQIAAGSTLIGYRSNRSFVELGAVKFNSYLEDEGIEFIREQRRARGEDDQPAPEYFIRCAKALLQVGGGTPADEVYKTNLGYTLELIALDNPYLLSVGDELSFQVLYRNEPAVNLLVQAFTEQEPEQKQKIRTDENGRVTLTLQRSGNWLVKVVNIQPIIADPKALWQSYWASFTFVVE